VGQEEAGVPLPRDRRTGRLVQGRRSRAAQQREPLLVGHDQRDGRQRRHALPHQPLELRQAEVERPRRVGGGGQRAVRPAVPQRLERLDQAGRARGAQERCERLVRPRLLGALELPDQLGDGERDPEARQVLRRRADPGDPVRDVGQAQGAQRVVQLDVGLRRAADVGRDQRQPDDPQRLVVREDQGVQPDDGIDARFARERQGHGDGGREGLGPRRRGVALLRAARHTDDARLADPVVGPSDGPRRHGSAAVGAGRHARLRGGPTRARRPAPRRAAGRSRGASRG